MKVRFNSSEKSTSPTQLVRKSTSFWELSHVTSRTKSSGHVHLRAYNCVDKDESQIQIIRKKYISDSTRPEKYILLRVKSCHVTHQIIRTRTSSSILLRRQRWKSDSNHPKKSTSPTQLVRKSTSFWELSHVTSRTKSSGNVHLRAYYCVDKDGSPIQLIREKYILLRVKSRLITHQFIREKYIFKHTIASTKMVPQSGHYLPSLPQKSCMKIPIV
jgi:hypothetical protein